MFDVESFILVGGASRRMGSDKSQLVFNGRTSLERIAGELETISLPVALVGARQSYRHLSLPNVPDVHSAWGALGGIHAALHACARDWALIVACDLPFVTGQLFERLAALRSDFADAVVPVQADGRPQPLCAFYRRDSCLAAAERLIARGEHTPRALLAAVRTRWVEVAELEDLTGAKNFFFNVNTPADFAEAEKVFAETGGEIAP